MPQAICGISREHRTACVLQALSAAILTTASPPALRPVQTVLEAGGSFAGVNRKVQLKPTKWSEPEEGSAEQPRITEALLILKHGGVLTHAGRQQACAASSNLLHLRLFL